MTQPKISAAKQAQKDPKFLPWLHELTHLGYEKKILVETAHMEVIAFHFLQGLEPLQALSRYEQFKRRWIAIKKGNRY